MMTLHLCIRIAAPAESRQPCNLSRGHGQPGYNTVAQNTVAQNTPAQNPPGSAGGRQLSAQPVFQGEPGRIDAAAQAEGAVNGGEVALDGGNAQV